MKKIYIVSLGPGDPELIVLKGILALARSEVIIIPTQKKEDTDSRTKRIITALQEKARGLLNEDSAIKLREQNVYDIYSPMQYDPEVWFNQLKEINNLYSKYDVISYVTLGDVAIYSTAYYLIHLMQEKYPDMYDALEVIPGISSYSDASAKIKQPLCLGKSDLKISHWQDNSTKITQVYMRPKSGDSMEHLKEHGSMYYFENLGFENEKIKTGKPDTQPPYMSLLIDFANKIEY